MPKSAMNRPAAVHPRACGERLACKRATFSFAGSSPRLRGTGGNAPTIWRGGRFIPAPAGNGLPLRSPPSQPPVHPRACGERRFPAAFGLPCRGSSPRLRGTELKGGVKMREGRFIPAPAGNGKILGRNTGGSPVHPRACGERWAIWRGLEGMHGSSPRLRGTGMAEPSPVNFARFIPAPAGNGILPEKKWSLSAVHPRACGERRAPRLRPSPRPGSSPRLRGTDSQARLGNLGQRFIPAPAGNGVPIPARAAI